MIRYIDEHKDRFGVEGICRVLGEQLACGFLTASGYWAAKRREPAARTLSDRELVPIIERLHAANLRRLRDAQDVVAAAPGRASGWP